MKLVTDVVYHKVWKEKWEKAYRAKHNVLELNLVIQARITLAVRQPIYRYVDRGVSGPVQEGISIERYKRQYARDHFHYTV